MSLAGLLVQTAVVFRRQDGHDGKPYKTDRLGQPSRDEQETTRFACRVTRPKGGERNQERSHDVVQVTHELFAEREADVREQDVVTVLGVEDEILVDRAEVTLVRPVYDGRSEHHREILLSSQRQAT